MSRVLQGRVSLALEHGMVASRVGVPRPVVIEKVNLALEDGALYPNEANKSIVMNRIMFA